MRGQGRVFRPKVGKRQTAVWWLDYSVRGQRHRESSDTTVKRDAQKKLRERMGNRESGTLIGRPERVVLAEYTKDAEGKDQLVGGLRWLHERQYDLDGLRSKERVQQCWAHIEAFFPPPTRVTAVTPVRLDEYAAARLAAGVARQTVNHELSALRRAFNLAIEKHVLAVAPCTIKLPEVDNARQGFFEEGEFAAVLLALPGYAQAIVKFLRVTGWRVGEVLSLTWDRVDWEHKGIRLSARQTKGKQARVFPFGLAPDLKDVLAAAWAARAGLHVFQGPSAGKPLGYTTLLHHWQRATRQAGCAGRLMHDLRRTAAREFRRHGVDESTIMQLCGWRRREMFDRYNIINDADLNEALARRYGKQAANTPGTGAPTGQLS